MKHRFISAFIAALLLTFSSVTAVVGQSTDSLLFLLNNNLVKDDSTEYEILKKIIAGTTDVQSRLQYCDQAIKLAEKINIELGNPYVIKGNCYLDVGDLASALRCFYLAADYFTESGYDKGVARAYTSIAEAYNKQGNPENEKNYLRKALEISNREHDTLLLTYVLHNLGFAYYTNRQYDSALIMFSTTKDIFLLLGDTVQYAYCIGNSGEVYSGLSDFDKAEDNLLRAIEILTRKGDERAVTEFDVEYANVLLQKGEINKSIARASRSFNTAIKNGFKDYESDAAHILARSYEMTGRSDSAYYFLSIYLSDLIKNHETIKQMADLRTAYEVAQVQSEVDLLEKNKLYQRIAILALLVALLLAVGILLLYYNNLRRTKKLMAALDERRILLEKQSHELQEKNEELTRLYEISNNQKEEIISSINYAQRIQNAILPPETYITELINENFIFFKPKDIVSGDFYWIKQINHYIILVCADCTGHGVPGAFLSMLGISYLNEIIPRKEITRANEVLNELRKEIKHSLRQTGKEAESREGMDMAVCVIDTSKSIMQYSGAFIPLYMVSNTGSEPTLREFKADTMPVGVHFSSDKSFTNHEIKLEIGDTFYLSTDGFIDQDGDKTRFGTRNFKKMLLEISNQPMFEQRDILERTLSRWMGNHSQRDDILVIGARI